MAASLSSKSLNEFDTDFVPKLIDTEPDGEFTPGIQYNITMKIKPFTTSYRQPRIILDIDYK